MDNNQYEKLKEVIWKAVPNIRELKFGCEIRSGITHLTIVSQDNKEGFLWNEELDQPYHNSGSTVYDEIIGRPIRLADVLLAIPALQRFACQQLLSGRLVVAQTFEDLPNSKFVWNLSHDSLTWHYKNQPQTVEFLINLLVPNKEVV